MNSGKYDYYLEYRIFLGGGDADKVNFGKYPATLKKIEMGFCKALWKTSVKFVYTL